MGLRCGSLSLYKRKLTKHRSIIRIIDKGELLTIRVRGLYLNNVSLGLIDNRIYHDMLSLQINTLIVYGSSKPGFSSQCGYTCPLGRSIARFGHKIGLQFAIEYV